MAYVESHDQALVGDKTMIFRLADANMYTDMNKDCHNPVIDRAIALHKMIRLFTIAGGGEAYLNFMGNEFGHPEWIDFPREGTGWSFHYCRRQWSLMDNGFLKYQGLGEFDRDVVLLTKEKNMFSQLMGDLRLHQDKVIVFYRKGLLFAFNFHHSDSYEGVRVPVPNNADYTVALTSDDEKYGGFGQIAHMTYPVKEIDGQKVVELYLPARTAVVLVEGEIKDKPAEAKAEEKPKRTRKTAAKKAADSEEKPKRTRKTKAEKEAEAVAEEKPKRKRTTKKAAETAEPAEEKPKRTRKTKKAETAE